MFDDESDRFCCCRAASVAASLVADSPALGNKAAGLFATVYQMRV